MQYEVNTPKQYLEALDEDWRKEKLVELRGLILQTSPDITESINYKMLCYKQNGSVLFHLNAQKNYVSLYCGDSKKVDPDGRYLKGLNLGKGCIRFSKTKVVSQTGINKFIKKAVLLHKDDIDLGC